MSDSNPPGQVSISDMLRNSMAEYAQFVASSRALPDLEDGLKPVHRRIAFTMFNLKGLEQFSTSARFVGDTMGGYHPHGDAAVYGTMVGMVGGLRYPLILGKGNWGGLGEGAAAYRYTSAKLADFSRPLFDDLSVTDWTRNFDNTRDEPVVLPSQLPLLLLNGSQSIAVGLTCNIPPHNLEECVEACLYLLTDDSPNLSGVLDRIKGPDYGYGELITSREELHKLYETGKGTLWFCCPYDYHESGDEFRLILRGFCPGWRASTFRQGSGDWVGVDNLPGIRKVIDRSASDVEIEIVGHVCVSALVREKLWGRVTYNFNVLDEGTLKESVPLLVLLQRFLEIRQRRVVARAIHEKAILSQKLERVRARILALDHPEEMKKALTADSLVDSEKILQSVGMSAEQIKLVLDSTFRSLLKSNKAKVKAEEAELVEGIAVQDDIILKPKEEIARQLIRHRNAYGDGYRMPAMNLPTWEARINEQVPAVSLPALLGWKSGDTGFTLMLRNELKSGLKWCPSLVCAANKFVTVVGKKNWLWKCSVPELLVKKDLNDDLTASEDSIVGLVGDTDTHVVLVDTNGQWIVLDLQKLNAGVTTAFKSNVNVIQAVCGFRAGDKVLLWEKDSHKLNAVDSAELISLCSRPGSWTKLLKNLTLSEWVWAGSATSSVVIHSDGQSSSPPRWESVSTLYPARLDHCVVVTTRTSYLGAAPKQGQPVFRVG